jgi:hypothetical protein
MKTAKAQGQRRKTMGIGRKSACVFVALGLLFIFGIAGQGWIDSALAGQGQDNPNGSAGQRPAYYDGDLFTINMFELPSSETLIGHNASINIIYASNDLDEEQDFISVIDAIQGDGFNPLWLQVLIVFNEGFTPHQFFSDDEVLEAAEGENPEITLVETDEVYRCSVVGKKK